MDKTRASDDAHGSRPYLDLSTGAHPRSEGSLKSSDSEGLSDLEHVAIAIQGSNCPGCIRKISKALESMPFLYNLRLRTIPLQAEFDLDLSKVSVRKTMRLLRTRTGRCCERIGDGWQKLQVSVPTSSADLEDSLLPYGVRDIERVGKDRYSIKYDARKVGARDLMKALAQKDCTLQLDRVKSYDELPKDIRQTGLLTLISIVLTLPILILAWAPLPKHKLQYDIASLVLATTVQIVVAGPFYPKAFTSLFANRAIDMDLLVVLSTSITYVLSVASFICEVLGTKLTSGMYFETSTLLISLIMVGRFMADFACHQVIKSRSVRSLQPQSAFLVDIMTAEKSEAQELDTRLLHFGDNIEIRQGCPAPTDGVVFSGNSQFDESILTGEACLVHKSRGCKVIAGSTNKSATVVVQVTRLPGDNSISDIADMVEEVSRSKPKSQVLADKVACWIVPAIGTLALLTFFIWILIGKLVRRKPAGSAILGAIPYAVSVLVVSCPCAIGLAVPIVQVIAGSVAARYGLMLRSADVMTRARKVTHVVFDKTGTLTHERLTVVDEHYCSESLHLAIGLTHALASSSEHPVSTTVAEHLKKKMMEAIHVTDIERVIGKGVKGRLNGQTVRIGNARWLGIEHRPLVRSLLSRSLTVLCVAHGDEVIAVFGLQAVIRAEAVGLVVKLKERGIQVSIMSGDETGAVHDIATKLQIPLEDARARCTPQEKQQRVKELMQSKANTVLFCGDGANDAAALARASVGVHICHGAGFADSAADAIITGASLKALLVLLDLSRDCYRQILFNFSWSAFYNIFAILFAAGLFIKIRLPPEYAGLGEAISVLPIVIVPLRLRWKSYTYT